MNVDPNVIICVIAVCAIISPAIVAIVNNHHSLKVRELELKNEKEKENVQFLRSVFEDYVKNTNAYMSTPSGPNRSNYLESYSLALAYFPKEARTLLDQIDGLVSIKSADSVKEEIATLSIVLSDFMKS